MNQKREERAAEALANFPEGSIVRVKDPDQFITAFANKVRDRLGEVVGHQMPTPNPIVTFHAIGRKKRHQQVFRVPGSDLEVITDAALIAEWRAAVDATKLRALTKGQP